MLILEPTKVYQPSYLSINKDVDDNTVSIWHVAPDDKVGVTVIYIIQQFVFDLLCVQFCQTSSVVCN